MVMNPNISPMAIAEAMMPFIIARPSSGRGYKPSRSANHLHRFYQEPIAVHRKPYRIIN